LEVQKIWDRRFAEALEHESIEAMGISNVRTCVRSERRRLVRAGDTLAKPTSFAVGDKNQRTIESSGNRRNDETYGLDAGP